jgi:CRP-like cAMP-binding protein
MRKAKPLSRSNHSRPNCSGCQVRQFSPLCDVAEEALAELDGRKLFLTYQPGQILFSEGEAGGGIYCINSGVVALEKMGGDQESSVVGVRRAGDSLGYRAFATDGPHLNTAEATTECGVCYIEKSMVKGLLKTDPASVHRFVREMIGKNHEAEMLFIGSRTLPVRGRLANALLVLRESYATADEVGCLTFELPFSRRLLASMVGARPESLSRAIRALEHDGIAQFLGRTVLVSDLDLLLDEVGQ